MRLRECSENEGPAAAEAPARSPAGPISAAIASPDNAQRLLGPHSVCIAIGTAGREVGAKLVKVAIEKEDPDHRMAAVACGDGKFASPLAIDARLHVERDLARCAQEGDRIRDRVGRIGRRVAEIGQPERIAGTAVPRRLQRCRNIGAVERALCGRLDLRCGGELGTEATIGIGVIAPRGVRGSASEENEKGRCDYRARSRSLPSKHRARRPSRGRRAGDDAGRTRGPRGASR
jgi:hypothetical protein